MSKVKIKAGTTSYSVEVFIADSSSSTGAGLSTLTSATSGLTAEYRRRGQSSWTAIPLVGSGGGKVLGTWTSGGFLSDGQGMYELDLPNAVLATGATGAYVRLYGATNMLLTVLEIELDAVDYQDSMRFGLTAIPNATAGGNGGLPTGDANGLVGINPLHSLILHNGTAQAGASASITLAAGASATNDLYKGLVVKIYSGTGAGQTRTITAYNGTTKVATVGRAWATNPDSTSLYGVQSDQSPVLTSNLGVTVGGYEAGQDPATLLLATPANKLATDSSGQVTVGTIASVALASIWSIGSNTLTTAGSIGKRIVDFLTGDIFARLGAPAGASVSADIAANQSAILNITQGTFLATDIPSFIERPDSGTESLIITLVIADETGAATNLDAAANPSLVLVDHTGTSQASRLGAWSNLATGKYQITYTSSATDGITRLRWEITGTINGKVRRYVQSTEIVDTTAVSFTAADRTNLGAIKAKTDNLPADPASNTQVNTRMATFAYTAPDNTGIANAAASAATAAAQATTAASQSTTAATQATNAAASASSADGKLTTQRLANIDAATPTRLTALDWIISMIELVSGQRRWTAGALSQAPSGSGGGSAGTQLIALPLRLVVEGQNCSTDRLATISLRLGTSVAQSVQLVDAAGSSIPTTGTTLSAKIMDGTDPLVEGLTVEEVLGSQGRISVLIDTREAALASVTYATLVVTRDNGDSDVTTYPAQLFIER